MGFWKRLRSFFASGEDKVAAGGLLAALFGAGNSPRRGTKELLQAYRTHPWLHAVVHRIAFAVSQNGFELYRPPRRGEKARARRWQTKDAVGYGPESEELESHPFLDLLANPNPLISAGVFMYLVSAYLDIKGEIPIVVERGASGKPLQLWPIPPHWLVDLPRTGSPYYRFSYAAWQRLVPETDVIFIRYPDLEQPYARGVGTAETLADEIDIDEFATKYLKGWFFNKGVPDIFLSVENVSSEAEARRYEEVLRQKYAGGGKGNQVHVTNGKVDVKEIGRSFKDQQLPDLRAQERDIVLQVFSVPPEVMGVIENSNRATIDAANYLFTTGVVFPRLSFIADAFTAFARVAYNDPSLVVGFCSPVPEDTAFQLTVFTAQPTLFTKNEWRSLGGRPPVEGWDEEFPEVSVPSFGAPPSSPQLPACDEEPDLEDPEEDAEPEEPEDMVEESTRALPAVTTGMSESDIRKVANALRPERLDGTTSKIVATIEEWGRKILDELGSEARFDIRNPLVKDYLDAWQEQRIVGITKSTREDVTAVLQDAVAEGVGIDEMRRRLKGYFADASDYRAERIARTEVVSSSNAANLAAYQISGLVDGKEWLSVQDGKTRDTHRAMDGQSVGISDDFSSPSGAKGQGPGLFGRPEEDINCRCTLVPRLEGKESPAGEERAVAWKKYDADLLPYEDAIRKAAAGAFRAWANDAVAALG